MKLNRKIHNPEDTFIKRSHAYLGDIMHNYHNLPGKYIKPITNQFPDKDGKEKKTDGSYIIHLEDEEEYERISNFYRVELDEKDMKKIFKKGCQFSDAKEMIINIEDESSRVNCATLAKDLEYSDIMRYAYKLPVYSVITTPLPKERCKEYYVSGTTIFIPKIISYDEMDGRAKLEEHRKRVNNGVLFTNEEGYELILILRMIDEHNMEILEEVCDLYYRMKLSNPSVKWELGKCLECLINKYADTLEDINYLEGLIHMEEINNLRIEREKRIHEEGRLELAREFVKEFGADKVSKISRIDKKLLL